MVGFILSIVGLCVLSFYAGATLAWAYAKGSLDVPAPLWMPAVNLLASALFVTAALLRGDWFSALTMAAFWLLITGVQVWHIRRSRRAESEGAA